MRLSLVGIAMVLCVAVTGCAEPAETGISEAQRKAGHAFGLQYEKLTFKTTLKESCRKTIDNSMCSLLVPEDWTQTARTHFERVRAVGSPRAAEVIKLIEYPTYGGDLESAVDQFAATAAAFIENYEEKKRWSTTIDGHPAIAICYEHAEELVEPVAANTTKAYFTVKHDPYERSRMRTVIISCTAPTEMFGEAEALFDEIACRTMLTRDGS